jgi:hydroxymethylbilane synthase
VKLTYATRKSPLALAQCRAFIAELRAKHPDLETIEEQVVTTGDRVQDRPLSEIGGKGLFVKEIEEALIAGLADIAVHSMKDVPGKLPEGLVIACVPHRADPRDVLVSPKFQTLAKLPADARVGTSSLRRMVSLKIVRPDLAILPIRGNVDTRLRKVDAGEFDAIVLAHAGLVRLGLGDRATEMLASEVSLPAVGQGALGIECRADDHGTRDLLAAVHDPTTSVCVAAERGVLIALEGDCKTPLAAFAEKIDHKDGPRLRLRAFVAAPDGSGHRSAERDLPWPNEVDALSFGLTVGSEIR